MKRKTLKILIVMLVLMLALSTIAFAGVGGHISGGSDSSSSSSRGGGISGNVPLPVAILLVIGVVAVHTVAKKGREWGLPEEIVVMCENLWEMIRKAKQSDNSQHTGKTLHQSAGAPKLTDATERIEYEIHTIDPDFSSSKFIAWAKEVFLKVNKAWDKKDWSVIRPFENEALFNMHSAQLQEYIDKGTTNHIEKIMVNQTYMYKYDRDNAYEHVTLALDSRLVTYVSEDNTGKVVSGAKDREVYITYLLTFMRKVGVKTNVELSNKSTSQCPNCGAPTEITSAGKCEFCKMIITTGDHDWVLTHFDSLTARTVVDTTPVTITATNTEKFIDFTKESVERLEFLAEYENDADVMTLAHFELDKRSGKDLHNCPFSTSYIKLGLIAASGVAQPQAATVDDTTDVLAADDEVKCCVECGTEVPSGKKFCEVCGTKAN